MSSAVPSGLKATPAGPAGVALVQSDLKKIIIEMIFGRLFRLASVVYIEWHITAFFFCFDFDPGS